MDEQRTDAPQPKAQEAQEAQKEWLRPELIFEEVKEVTLGGSGDEPVFSGEDKITTYYHS